eukprot:s803_g18.t2
MPWKVVSPPFMHPSVEEEVLDFGWRELIVSVYRSSNLSVALWNVDSVDPKLGAHALHVQCVLALAPHGFVCECKVRKYSGVIGDLEDAVDREVRGLYHEITRTTGKLYDGVRLSDNGGIVVTVGDASVVVLRVLPQVGIPNVDILEHGQDLVNRNILSLLEISSALCAVYAERTMRSDFQGRSVMVRLWFHNALLSAWCGISWTVLVGR